MICKVVITTEGCLSLWKRHYCTQMQGICCPLYLQNNTVQIRNHRKMLRICIENISHQIIKNKINGVSNQLKLVAKRHDNFKICHSKKIATKKALAISRHRGPCKSTCEINAFPVCVCKHNLQWNWQRCDMKLTTTFWHCKSFYVSFIKSGEDLGLR